MQLTADDEQPLMVWHGTGRTCTRSTTVRRPPRISWTQNHAAFDDVLFLTMMSERERAKDLILSVSTSKWEYQYH
jgi:hypothetical protein